MLHSNKTFLLFSFNPGLCLAHTLGVASLVAYCQLIHNLKYTKVCPSIYLDTKRFHLPRDGFDSAFRKYLYWLYYNLKLLSLLGETHLLKIKLKWV